MNFFSLSKKTILLLIIFIISCDSARRFYMTSSDSEMQEIETKDHQFCISRGLDFNETPLKTELYWRCRLLLAKHKLKSDISLPKDLRFNGMIKQLIKNIEKNYNESYEQWGDDRNSLFNNNDHDRCITQGYKIETLEYIEVEDYFSCRKKLISGQQIVPPYHQKEYFKRSQDSYNTPFAINKNIDKNNAAFLAAQEKYPVCVRFRLLSDEFKECSADFDSQRQCLKKIDDLKFKRELKEKTACQKKAYIRYPDGMLQPSAALQEEIKQDKINADLSNNSSFYSIGIYPDQVKQFEGAKSEESAAEKEAAKEAAKKKKEKKPLDKNFNTKNELYNKIDLTRLRQEFVIACQHAVDPELELYGKKLTDRCNAIKDKWEIKK